MSKSSNNIPNKTYVPVAQALYLLPTGLGILLSLEMIQLWPDLYYMYSPQGILPPELLAAGQENLGLSIIDIHSSLASYLPAPFSPLYAMAILYIACCIGMSIHWYDRYCTLVLLLLHHSFFLANYTWSYGADYLAQVGLFFCLLFGGSSALRPRLVNWTTWGHRLFALQLTAVYFFAGLGKAVGISWWTGEAVWKAVQQPFGQVLWPVPDSLHAHSYLWVVLGWATTILELSYAVAWRGNRFRKIIACSTIALHLGIFISIGLTHFSLLMIWYNCSVWLLPHMKLAKPIINTLTTDYIRQQAAFCKR